MDTIQHKRIRKSTNQEDRAELAVSGANVEQWTNRD